MVAHTEPSHMPSEPTANPPSPASTAAGRLPTTVDEWRSAAAALLSPPCCAFHRNLEITSWYAWLYQQSPPQLKWAAMAALASHHIRRVLFPLRLDADRRGLVERRQGRTRRARLTVDAHLIREVNNAIFDDIFWVHLAYLADGDGLDRLRALLSPLPHYEEVLAAFEKIDAGRGLAAGPSESEAVRRQGIDLVWQGNVELLAHEQSAVVQPHFERLSPMFARLVSLGAATTFDVRGVRQEVRYFTSFYVFSLTNGLPRALSARAWPRMTRLDDRWRWLETSVVPRFRSFEESQELIAASLDRVTEESRRGASRPCLAPA